MSTPRVAAILHGARWPAGDVETAWRARLAGALGHDVPVAAARESQSAPRGAAALIAAALAQVDAAQVLVVDVNTSPDDDTLRRLVGALDTHGLAVRHDAPVASGPDARWQERWLAARHAAPPALVPVSVPWAARRQAVADVGGLDTSLWSHGLVDDLAARLAAHHVGTAWLGGTPGTAHADSYPLDPAVDLFLRWRTTLRLAFRHAPAEALGEALTTTLLGLLTSSWRATGLDALGIAFGGDWGRASLATKLRTRLGGPPPDQVWPADEAATAIPLAALHAFAHELPSLARARAARGLLPPVSRDQTAATDEVAPRQAHAPAGDGETPRVSVIVVNWNGRDHLEACFSSLLASDHPADRLELICVDNGSTDDSVALLSTRFPQVRVVRLPGNRGFTGGNAAGVEAATGDVLVFVNNDMRFEPAFLSRLVSGLTDGTACAGARVMNWDGTHIDFVRGTASFEARGYQEQYGQAYTPGLALAESFFPNGGAFAVTRRAYDESGGFDPALFAYYDDVDLGWRLRMAGHDIRTVADAVAFHRHGATVRTQPHAHKRFVLARNALWIAVRNYDDRTLPHVMPALLLLAGLRVAQDLVWLGTPLHARLRPWLEPSRRHAVPADVYVPAAGSPAPPARVLAQVAMPELAAIGATLQDLPRLLDAHDAQQRRRRVPDDEVLPFLGRPFDELDGRRSYRLAQKALVEALGLRARLGIRPHVLLLTHEALRANMSGPAIRVLEMARALSRTARVTVCAPAPMDVRDDRVALVPFDPARPSALKAQAGTADAVVVQGFALNSYPFLSALVCPIVADLYCPFTIEHLEQQRAAGGPIPPAHERDAAAILSVQNAQLQQADFFLCASERQRDFWIGALHTAGRVNPRTVGRDADLRSLIDVVPFGLPTEDSHVAAARARERRLSRGEPAAVMKGVHPAIRETDRVLLWGGSLLDWQDPETLIEAVARLARTRDDVKLFFMGVKHPNPQVTPMAVVERSRRLAESLGVAGTHVIFNDWVPYEERASYLTEADIGVSTHHWHLETRYAFRTRMLDYLWARLPIVCSEGDHFGDLVRTRGLGRAVPPGDAGALADAIAVLLDSEPARDAARAALADVADTLTWDRVVEPLRRWCADPGFAADRAQEVVAFRAHMNESFKASRWLKRTALSLGVKEADVEAMKRWGPVRAGMSLRNAVAIHRARRKARRA